MKRYSMIILSMILLYTLVACSSANNVNNGSAATNANTGAEAGAEKTGKSDSPSETIPPLDPNKKSTIVFSMFRMDPYFEAAKIAYEKKHPNITIDLKYVVRKGNDDVSGTLKENYLATTIADFLGGKGPDMLVTDHLPVTKYVGNNLFANLSLMMERDPAFKKEQYFQNVLDNVGESDGGIYAMPLSFSLSGLTGDEEVLEKSGVAFDDKTWTWDNFMETGNKLSASGDNRSVLSINGSPEDLLEWWVLGNYDQLVDLVNRKAYFDSDLFIHMMEQIKTMEEEGLLSFNSKSDDAEAKPPYFEEWGFDIPYQYFFNNNNLKKRGYKEPKVYALPIADGQEPGGHFTPQMNIAINANSSIQPEAWDFLKFLMSGEEASSSAWGPSDLTYEGQGYNGLLPISRKVFEEKSAQLLQAGQVESVIPSDGMIKVTEEDLEQLESIIVNANKPLKSIDIGVNLYNEVKPFFSGQKSAQAVANIIQNKVTTYLNE